MRKSVFLIVLILLLAACKEEETPIPPPQPSTPIPQQQEAQPTFLPTRIVTLTPRPTEGPTAIPTPSFDYEAYVGEWTLLLRYEIKDYPPLETAVYSLSGGVNITFDGLVFGSGTFSPTLASGECVIQPTDVSGLGVAIAGRLREELGRVVVDLTLTPTTPDFEEQYESTCYDKLDGSQTTEELSGAFLFPVLAATNQMKFTFDLSQYGSRQVLELDLAEATNNQFQGTLSAETYFGF